MDRVAYQCNRPTSGVYLVKAEKTLTIVETADPERARHLWTLRAAIAQLMTLVPLED